ncbi:dCTP deaminase [Helicobacter muridarum]|uniref:dCTP deaminase n=1 Tax=Helicobacter muridarum TaxID=216 RepID=A0A099TYK6_9HELI|nr:dCTP deaminase [Helicobacter muridarum]TLE00779.1 dCTP deaminase [Helicobacter muridarum]STQ86538.1 deoxycytidine triphosphate deaminase [Helicobacter muridarum]
MGLKSDTWIRKQSLEFGMIEPFVEAQVSNGVISYGLSSYGYDVRVSYEFVEFSCKDSCIIDPKNFKPEYSNFTDVRDKGFFVIPPNSFVLARTVEYFRIPRDVLSICVGKSTYARCGIIVNVTPFEPEFEGFITIEISNTTHLPARVYANEGIAQVLFFTADETCNISYKDRGGKYQHQTGVTLPKMR